MPGEREEPPYRVTRNMMGDGCYEVSEVTASDGLIVRLSALERWQSYAIVAILAHPFSD